MDIKDLKELNEYALRDREELIIDQIKYRREFQTADEVEVSKNILECSINALEDKKECFDVPYKVIRDIIFKYYRSCDVKVVGFVQLLKKDGLSGQYAVGLYDLQTAKAKGISALDACKSGDGVLIAIMPMRVAEDSKGTLVESAFYDTTVNLLHAKEIYGLKGLEIETYHNALVGNFEFNDELWRAVEITQKVKDKEEEIEK